MQAAQMQQQQASIQAQIQAQSLQNQLLQQSLQSEILKQQLMQLQQQNQTAAASSPKIAGALKSSKAYTAPLPPLSPSQQVEIDKSHPGGVHTLKRAYESRMPVTEAEAFDRPMSPSRKNNSKVMFSDEVSTIPQTAQSPPTSPAVSRPSASLSPSSSLGDTVSAQTLTPPLSPPLTNVTDTTTVSTVTSTTVSESVEATSEAVPLPPRMPSEPPAPPPTPPSTPISPQSPTHDPDIPGRAKVVRVGKIQWPPPLQEKHKTYNEVGKLLIDEATSKPKTPVKSKEDAHRRTMELIRMRSKDADSIVKTDAKPSASVQPKVQVI